MFTSQCTSTMRYLTILRWPFLSQGAWYNYSSHLKLHAPCIQMPHAASQNIIGTWATAMRYFLCSEHATNPCINCMQVSSIILAYAMIIELVLWVHIVKIKYLVNPRQRLVRPNVWLFLEREVKQEGYR